MGLPVPAAATMSSGPRDPVPLWRIDSFLRGPVDAKPPQDVPRAEALAVAAARTGLPSAHEKDGPPESAGATA